MGSWTLTNRVYVERFFKPFLAVLCQNNILCGVELWLTTNSWQTLWKNYFYNQISFRFWTIEWLKRRVISIALPKSWKNKIQGWFNWVNCLVRKVLQVNGMSKSMKGFYWTFRPVNPWNLDKFPGKMKTFFT